MRMIKTFLIGGAGLAAIATAAPSTAQYYGYQYNPYASSRTYQYNPYSYGYGNGYAMNTSAAASQCTAAVQNRLYSRNGIGGVLGALVGSYGSQGRVLSVTRVTPNQSGVRVRGLASSGRYGYYGNTADLSFRCDVDYRGYVRNVDINRR